MKQLIWLSNSRTQLKLFPAPVRDEFGFALYLAQMGGMHVQAKPLQGLGSGVMEVRANDASGTYRAIYTVSIGDAIYVIHAFQKKAKSGIATPKAEIEIVNQRLKQLRKEIADAKRK